MTIAMDSSLLGVRNSLLIIIIFVFATVISYSKWHYHLYLYEDNGNN